MTELRHRRLLKDEWFDGVKIETTPSLVPAGEWRSTVRLTFYRKGVEQSTHAFGQLSEALNWVGWSYRAGDILPLPDSVPDDRCDQPGCAEQYSSIFQILHVCEPDGAEHDAPAAVAYFRRFCGEHSCRGDDSLEDRDSNYILIGRNGQEMRHDCECPVCECPDSMAFIGVCPACSNGAHLGLCDYCGKQLYVEDGCDGCCATTGDSVSTC